MSERIYLDYAASTPLLPNVKDKLLSVLDYYGNPSSLHSMGVKAKGLIDIAKDKIANKFNCNKDELYFTSGATMSNNQAILGFLRQHLHANIVISCIEHDDIYLMLEGYPYDLKHFIPCNREGFLDIDYLKEVLDKLQKENGSTLLSIQWANNEMGTIQDMKAICDLANSYPDVYIHSDATQYVPYFPININELGIDMLSCSAQKIGGLKGTGLLYVRDTTKVKSLIFGDQGLIGGTENVPGIVCIGEAIDSIDYSKERINNLKTKRDYLYEQIKDMGRLVGTFDNRLPNNICMVINGVQGENIVALLSDMGVCISSGSACSSHTNKASRTLKAMGYTDDEANNSIRITIGDNTSINELDRAAKYIRASIEALKN